MPFARPSRGLAGLSVELRWGTDVGDAGQSFLSGGPVFPSVAGPLKDEDLFVPVIVQPQVPEAKKRCLWLLGHQGSGGSAAVQPASAVAYPSEEGQR